MNTEVNPYSITWTKMMPPLKEWWIGKPPGLFTIFFNTNVTQGKELVIFL